MSDSENSKATVTMYRTTSCPFCVMAAEFLDELGVDYAEVSLDSHPDRWAATSALMPGHQTVPLIVIGEKPIGGLDSLRELHAKGELESMIRGE